MALLSNPYGGAACDVAISNNYDTVGTLTRSDLTVLTPTQIKAIFTDGSTWTELNSLLRTQFEMGICGIRREGMYEWLMSSNRPGLSKLIDIKHHDRGASMIQPFIMARQQSVVNDDFWVISTGFAIAAYQKGVTGPIVGTGLSTPAILANDTANGYTVAAGARVLRLTSAHDLALSAQYFLPGHFLYVLNRVAGAAFHGQWQILEAALAGDSTYIDVLVNIKGPDTTTVDTTPVQGVVIMGPNSVHDVESYCRNAINVNPWKHVPFFYGVRRWGRRVSSTYRELLKKLLADNKWFAEFQDLPIAERNRQDQLRDQKEWVNQFFYGRAISSDQSMTGWGSLRQITSVPGAALQPGTDGELFAYEALPVGVYDQLKACGQVTDLQNQTLNIQTFIENDVYNVIRARKQDGRPSNEVDIYTDSGTAGDFQTAFFQYEKSVFGDNIRLNVEEGSNTFGFAWKKFRVPRRPFGVIVNIITHNYFDDILNTFSGASPNTPSRGRFLAVLDLGKGGSIYPAILGTNRKTHITGEIEKLAAVDKTYACVMENPTIETAMTSVTSTAIVECPLKSIWKENFSDISMPP